MKDKEATDYTDRIENERKISGGYTDTQRVR
jgi:hypothetical protein